MSVNRVAAVFAVVLLVAAIHYAKKPRRPGVETPQTATKPGPPDERNSGPSSVPQRSTGVVAATRQTAPAGVPGPPVARAVARPRREARPSSPPVYVGACVMTDDEMSGLESDVEDWCRKAEDECESECQSVSPTFDDDSVSEKCEELAVGPDEARDELVSDFRRHCEDACDEGKSGCDRENDPTLTCDSSDECLDCRDELRDEVCGKFKSDCEDECSYDSGYSAQSACEDACEEGESTCRRQ